MTYDFKCSIDPEHKYTEIRGINEAQKRQTCPEKGCKGKLLRIFGAPPITFNGTGFSAQRG